MSRTLVVSYPTFPEGDCGHVPGDEAPRRTAVPRFISRNVRGETWGCPVAYLCFGFRGVSKARSLVLLLTFAK